MFVLTAFYRDILWNIIIFASSKGSKRKWNEFIMNWCYENVLTLLKKLSIYIFLLNESKFKQKFFYLSIKKLCLRTKNAMHENLHKHCRNAMVRHFYMLKIWFVFQNDWFMPFNAPMKPCNMQIFCLQTSHAINMYTFCIYITRSCFSCIYCHTICCSRFVKKNSKKAYNF